MDILVTGGAGYIGTTLVYALLERGHRVTVFDSLLFGVEPVLPLLNHPRFSFVRADIRDIHALEEHSRRADAFVHLAAIVGYPACAATPDDARSTNVEGSRNIAAVASRTRPVVFASTCSCYGTVSEGVCTEETPLNPLSLYAQTKAQAETLMRNECDAVVFRLATAYGVSPRMRLDLLVNDFVYRAVHEHRIEVYEPTHRRCFVHVRDIARAIHLALDHADRLAGQVFNVGDESHNCSKLELCKIIRKVVPDFTYVEAAGGHDLDNRDYEVSFSRIKALGFEASLSLEDGIRELAQVAAWIDRREPFVNVKNQPSG